MITIVHFDKTRPRFKLTSPGDCTFLVWVLFFTLCVCGCSFSKHSLWEHFYISPPLLPRPVSLPHSSCLFFPEACVWWPKYICSFSSHQPTTGALPWEGMVENRAHSVAERRAESSCCGVDLTDDLDEPTLRLSLASWNSISAGPTWPSVGRWWKIYSVRQHKQCISVVQKWRDGRFW